MHPLLQYTTSQLHMAEQRRIADERRRGSRREAPPAASPEPRARRGLRRGLHALRIAH